MSKAALDYFGEALVTKGRDAAISDWDAIVEGRAKSERAKRLQAELATTSGDQLLLLKRLIPQIVDSALFYALSSIESSPNTSLRVSIGRVLSDELRDVSDGLGAELFGDQGWIARFSKHRFEQ